MTNEAAALDLNGAMRALIEKVRTVDPDAQYLAAATELVRQADALLAPHVVDEPRMQAFLKAEDMAQRMEAAKDGLPFYDGRPISEIFKYSPVSGPLNPISAPAELVVQGDGDPYYEITGRGTFPTAHCGPPGSVHGGFVAAVLDELLGSVCMCNDLGGFTGTLTITYRSPTPLDTEIALRAWVTGTERRKVFAAGTMHDGDTLLAEAEGIFIRNAELSEVK